MRLLLVVLVAVATVCLIGPPAAAADVRGELDRRAGVRLTLAGRVLTAEIVRQPNVIREPETTKELFGRRIRGACGASFDRRHPRFVHRQRVWPRDALGLRFEFARDISRSVRWCLIEEADGGDIAFVSFVAAEPARFVAKGRSPGGQWWRLAAWRGEQVEPCVHARFADDSFSQCLHDEADREAGLAVVVQVPSCPGDTFVYGAASRSAISIELELFDGTTFNAELYRRPRGSRVRARYFMAALPGLAEVREVSARDGAGRTLGWERFDRFDFARPCGTVIPD